MALVTGWDTPWTNDFDPALTSGSVSGSDDRQRRTIYTAGTSGTQIRITLKAGDAQSDVDGTSIGPRSGTTDDFASAPTRITWDSGSNTTSIATNQTKVSDEITFSVTSGSGYLVHIFWDDTYSYAYNVSGLGGGYYKYGAGQSDETMTQNVAYSTSDTSIAIDKIEVGLGNVWQATCTTEPTNVWFNTTKGTEESAVANLDAANEWYWAANVLYVYSTSDPDTAYVSPGIGTDAPIDVLFFGTEL